MICGKYKHIRIYSFLRKKPELGSRGCPVGGGLRDKSPSLCGALLAAMAAGAPAFTLTFLATR